MTEKITATEPFAFDMVSIQISCLFPYLRGLASVAYPLSWQCESLKGGISNRDCSHAFFCIYDMLIVEQSYPGTIGR